MKNKKNWHIDVTEGNVEEVFELTNRYNLNWGKMLGWAGAGISVLLGLGSSIKDVLKTKKELEKYKTYDDDEES